MNKEQENKFETLRKGYEEVQMVNSSIEKVYPEAYRLARRFHEFYEQSAPMFGYITNPNTREFYPNSNNGRLMAWVCFEIVKEEKQALLKKVMDIVNKESAIDGQCPYGNDECPKCKPVNHEYSCRCSCHDLDQPNNRIREEWEERFNSIFDSFCEPNVTKTNEHPNCQYIFSCEEMENFDKDIKNFITELLKSQKESLIEKIKSSDKNFGIVDKNDKGGAMLIEDIINLIKEDK